MPFTLLAAVALAACVHAPTPAPRRLGDAMAELGTRFARSGLAVRAGRWELARYDVDELAEIFEDDLPSRAWAAHPRTAHAARAFDRDIVPTLRAAVTGRDVSACEQAFARAARACNACHVAAGFPFIEVPATLGATVPNVSAR